MKETVKRVLAATWLSHFPEGAPRPTSLSHEPFGLDPIWPGGHMGSSKFGLFPKRQLLGSRWLHRSRLG